ncbi:2-aminoethanethiol dioxygenase-like [Perognathus longimembris pacificus]|uniref:2-aminoethanethiol dioxygenase-like n=1 Tax=Perognathus longimembris pacificus TaxID=214514 RepID=UPI00201998B9|nr:2-aminoethanethiol dioxygenase-like [Perognathus longimembris pacificus]
MAAAGDPKGRAGWSFRAWKSRWRRLWRSEAEPSKPLIQRVARQASLTFPGTRGSGDGEASGGFEENLSRLRSLLGQVRARDVGLAGRRASPRARARAPGRPPVSYMSICETPGFSLGVFLLRAGARVPLHDHPGMHGLLRVLYGTVRISCLDKLEPGPGAPPPPPGAPDGAAPRPGVLRSSAEFTEASAPCVLTPSRDNLHQIQAVRGPAAFLDVLAPPYDPTQGRECRYYQVLERLPLGGTEEAPEGSTRDLPRAVWLLETPKAEDFWGEEEPYPGPKVLP